MQENFFYLFIETTEELLANKNTCVILCEFVLHFNKVCINIITIVIVIVVIIINISILKMKQQTRDTLNVWRTRKKSEPPMGFEPTTLRDLVGCSNH